MKTKIWHISDTHHRHLYFSDIPKVDIIIHSGDCSDEKNPYINNNEVLDFIEWYSSLDCEYKIFVAGNHDTSVESRIITKEQFKEAGIIYLENSGTTILGHKIWGSPYTPSYGEWAFMKNRNKIARVWDAMPEDTNILITHGPPKGVRDLSYNVCNQLEFCGDSALMKRIHKLKNSLQLVCFGHIHNFKDIQNSGISKNVGTGEMLFSNGACVTDGKFDYGLTSYGNIIEL